MRNRYKLNLSNEAKRELKAIRDLYGDDTLKVAFSDIREFPYIGKPLSRELSGRFSYRIEVHRIIYKIDEKEKMVKIITAGHRAHVYE